MTYCAYLIALGFILVTIESAIKRRWLLFILLLSFTLAMATYGKSLLLVMEGLGTDSFAETQRFGLDETLFYLQTLKVALYPSFINLLQAVAIATLLAVAVAKKIYPNPRLSKWLRHPARIGLFLIGLGIATMSMTQIKIIETNSSYYDTIVRNFSLSPPVLDIKRKGLKIVMYIGESTSVMNMGIYGYPRPTTPRLSQLLKEDKKLLVFNNVFSTHTHTSPSLLEAFSIGSDNKENYLSIEYRKRVPLIDTFAANGIKTYLYSNQGMTGAWNLSSSIVFKNSTVKKFSIESRLLGNNDRSVKRAYDHEFFKENLLPVLSGLAPKETAVIILHSMAGHGPYLENIPEAFRRPVDGYLSARNAEAVLGLSPTPVKIVEDYDSAIHYVDYSVNDSIDAMRQSKEPVVFIYFSDHGDSAFTKKGHDSSRFMHEMARVPFLMYFNESASNAYPDLFRKYSALSKEQSISTLAQLPATLLDLLDAAIVHQESPLVLSKVIGSSGQDHLVPIISRRTSQGEFYINLTTLPVQKEIAEHYIDVTDTATRIFALSQQNKDKKICYHRSNSIGKALRGALITNCLEFDLVVDEQGALNVYHPPATSVGLPIENIAAIAKNYKLGLWIDSKNINVPENCSKLFDYLDHSTLNGKDLLVEFPSTTNFSDTQIASCSRALKAKGISISYYVPTELLIECSKVIKFLADINTDNNCRTLRTSLLNAYNSNLFTDFSFDYRGIKVMEALNIAKKLRWNTWNVNAESYPDIKPERFNMVIVRSDKDPNSR